MNQFDHLHHCCFNFCILLLDPRHTHWTGHMFPYDKAEAKGSTVPRNSTNLYWRNHPPSKRNSSNLRFCSFWLWVLFPFFVVAISIHVVFQHVCVDFVCNPWVLWLSYNQHHSRIFHQFTCLWSSSFGFCQLHRFWAQESWRPCQCAQEKDSKLQTWQRKKENQCHCSGRNSV